MGQTNREQTRKPTLINPEPENHASLPVIEVRVPVERGSFRDASMPVEDAQRKK